TDVPATGKVRVRIQSSEQWFHLKVWADGDPEPESWELGVQSVTPSWWGRPEWQVEGGKANSANTVTVDDVTISRLNYTETDLAEYSYNDDHQVTTETLPMGAVRTWGYEDGRVTTMTQTGAGIDSTASVSYDTSGRIDTETLGGNTIDYGYDTAGQLTSITPTGGPTETITYTPVGQRNTHTTTAGTTTYNYNDAAELTSTTGANNTTYTNDAAGRRLTETTGTDTTSYHYDPAGRHLGVTDPTGTTLRDLDPDGNPEHVATTPTSGPTETARLQWDTTQANPQLTAITDPSGTTNTLVRANSDQAWSTLTTGVTKQPLAADIHRSTVADGPAAAHATAASYNAFGQPATGPAHQPTLGYRSETTIEGLTHLRARQYDPTTGTFTTTDPLPGIPGTTTLNNPYHYTNNNPLNLTDPTGLQPTDKDFTCRYSWAQSLCDHSDTIIGVASIVAAGAIAVAAAPAFAAYGTITAAAALGGLGGLTQSALEQWGTTERLNSQRLAQDTAISAFVSVTLASAASLFTTTAKPPTPSAARVVATGQEHHVISRRIAGALADHPALAGQYTARDPRFVTRAVDAAAHRGYQTWHRLLDTEVVDWLARNPNATTSQFEQFLRGRYAQSDLIERFPNGF
ncbi:MAG: RHS repeat-associated core domain-containing protein, partial [Microthrixaceae bacterium]